MKWFILLALLVLDPVFADTTESLPMPKPSSAVPAATIESLHGVVEEFNRAAGSWPARFSSPDEKKRFYLKWVQALQQAWLLETRDGNSEMVLAVLADLYRQGHNMDVPGAGDRANEAIQKCLGLWPDSVACHFSASYFYLSINPRFAPKGEASLLRLRTLLAPKINMNVERGLVFAYLYQERNKEALQQLDYIIQIDPAAAWAKEFRKGLLEGKGKVMVK